METSTYEEELKNTKICRFCLTQDTYILKSIYTRDEKIKSTAPLPLQIMAIASIEAHSDDGMPIYVCNDCRIHFEYCYRFKQMCKKADTQLRQYQFLRKLPEPLMKPKLPIIQTNQTNTAAKSVSMLHEVLLETPLESVDDSPTSTLLSSNSNTFTENLSYNVIATPIIIPSAPALTATTSMASKVLTKPPKRLHNANPSQTPEPPIPKRIKMEKTEAKNPITISASATSKILDKVDGNEMTIDDVKLLIEAAENDDILFLDDGLNCKSGSPINDSELTQPKPKLLNKASKRILNKEAGMDYEPRISAPQVKRNEDGNVEIVTEILDPNEPYDSGPDPLKSATPIETNVFPCTKCIRTFPLKQLLDIHMEKHNRDRPHPCTECGKSFFTKYDLQKHVVIHTGEKPFKCSVCDKAFNRAALLHHHEKTHPDVAKFICIYCEKPFISKDELQKHMQRHMKHRPFECKLCNKSFAFKQGLERHEAIHSKDHPHHCEYCEMSFTTPGKLARHLTAHAGERAFPCKYCGKTFILSHHLTRHLRSHKEFISDFICSACKAVHTTREEFIAHCTTHALQCLICPLCKDNLKNKAEVEKHMMDHEKKDGFACEYCDLMFTENSKLSKHLQTDHKNMNTKQSLAKNKRTLQQFQEHLLDEVLIDDDTVNDETDEDEQQVVTETIKIEPLNAEDEKERASLERQELMRNKSEKQLQAHKLTASARSSNLANTKQTTLNVSSGKSSLKSIKASSNKQTPTTASGGASESSVTPMTSSTSSPAVKSGKSLPIRRTTTPPIIKKIMQQQQKQQQQQQKQTSSKGSPTVSTASNSNTSTPPRILRVVKKTSPNASIPTSSKSIVASTSSKNTAKEKPGLGAISPSINAKVKRLALTKQELNELVKKGHKIVRVPKSASK